MSLPFLLEIGTEEIPDWMIPDALENLRLLFEKLEIPHESVTAGRHAAPPGAARRRSARAPGRYAKSACWARRNRRPPQAVAGFARKQGVEPEDLTVETTPKGEYYTFLKKVPGRRTMDILAEALPGLILQIYFPKTMYWTGKGGPRFIRPIRWIVALLGDEIVPFELAGVRSGTLTSGPSPAGRARDRRHHRGLRTAPARSLRDSLGRRAARQDSQRAGGRPRQARRRRCSKPWSTSPNTPRPSPAASIRSSWNCPKKC